MTKSDVGQRKQAYAACVEGRSPASQQHKQYYNRPTQSGNNVNWIGEACHPVQIKAEQMQLVEMDADHWKTWVHQRLSTRWVSRER